MLPDKKSIRECAKERRGAMPLGEVIEKSYAISLSVLESDLYRKAGSVMLYMPIGNEVSTSLIKMDAEENKKSLYYPVTDEITGEIKAYRVTEKTKFQKGAFSIPEPKGARVAKPEEIDLVIVPGVAFSKNGARVGFGKGCYDRFLKKTKAKKVGVCYELQLFDSIPEDKNDIRMDYIVTEKGMIKCK